VQGGAASSPRCAHARDGGPSGMTLHFEAGSVQIVLQGSATERDGEAIARGLWAELRRIAEEAA
jgi:hypothetical protein